MKGLKKSDSLCLVDLRKVLVLKISIALCWLRKINVLRVSLTYAVDT